MQVIAPTYFFADTGCHVRVLEEARALQAAGCEVLVCTYAGGREMPGIPTVRTPGLPYVTSAKVGSSRRKPALDVLLLLRSAAAAVRFRPEVIHCHIHEGALIGRLLSWMLGVPMVFDFQGSMTNEMIDHGFLTRGGPWFRPLYMLEGWLNRNSDIVMTSSLHGVKLLRERFQCDPARIRPLVDAVNTDVFRARWDVAEADKLALRERLGIPATAPLVVYLGLLAEYQGVSHLLQAAARVVNTHPETRFLLMGYPGQDRYRALADSLGLADHVIFPGRIPYEEAPSYLAIGDVAVAPKLSATEGNGKLLNYMSVGLPVAAFDTPVSRELLGELGAYARLGDVDHLADTLRMLLTDPDQGRNTGDALRRRAIEGFSWTSTAPRLLDAYDTVSVRFGGAPGMQVMWTPWRMEYILSNKNEDCIFCTKPAENRDRENYILYRGRRAFIMLNTYPYSNGHILIAPYDHRPSLELLDEDTTAELMLLTRRGITALRQALRPEGLNVGANIGAAAGAGIAEHVHLHVVPRWAGDTNFMPVVGGVRLVPEVLETSYDRLLEAGIARS